jgi:hypothetical protein
MKAFARSLGIAAGALCAVASAHAGASRIGNAYYEDFFASQDCSAHSACNVVSAATPSDAYLRIRHFYCRIQVSPTAPLIDELTLDVYNGQPGTTGATLIKSVPLNVSPPVADTAAGRNWYHIEHEILLATGPNRYISITAFLTQAASTLVMTCGITGDMIPPP